MNDTGRWQDDGVVYVGCRCVGKRRVDRTSTGSPGQVVMGQGVAGAGCRLRVCHSDRVLPGLDVPYRVRQEIGNWTQEV